MQESLFTAAKLDDFVPEDHPLRAIRHLVSAAPTERTRRSAPVRVVESVVGPGGRRGGATPASFARPYELPQPDSAPDSRGMSCSPH